MGSSGEGGSSSHEGGGGGGGGGEVMGSSSVMSAAGGGGLIIGGEDDKSQGGDLFEAGDRSTGGNRWPRQETLALLKIRSEMDAVFRDSSLKGPLWEHISRKMAELGYHRSSKKCREKFENVYKYHKRTKDGRVGKSEGKTYRFFDQLEALEQHQPSPSAWQAGVPPQEAVPVRMVIPGNDNVTVTSSPHPITVVHTPQAQVQAQAQVQHPMQHYQHQAGSMPVNRSSPIQIENPFSSSATQSSSSLSGSDEEVLGTRKKKKRKWEDFFERLAKEVIRKQEELHKNFIDVVERMDRDRMVREEAWKAREMGRLNQEREILAQERSMAAAKDAALMTFLQKLSTQSQVSFPFPVQIQTERCGGVPVTTGTTATITQHHPPPQPQPQPPVQQVVAPIPIQAPPQPQPLMQPQVVAPIPIQAPPQPRPPIHTPPALAREPELVVANPINTDVDKNKTNNIGENQPQGSPSRWPKAEIEALINLRSKLDEKYQDSGPKGPLWEEISSSMKKLGYNRNAKRCKEKWENINKYFKKVKESNKRRPEDSKTCPYFHQLDALYRSKTLKMDTTGTSVSPNNAAQQQAKPENLNTMGPVLANPSQHWPIQDHQMEDAGSGNDSDEDGDYDDDDEGSGGYEIVANAGVNSKTTSTTVTLNE